MSSYNPLAPNGKIKLSLDYKNLQNNFSQADTTFGLNHYQFSNQTANNGKHKFVEMVAQAKPTILAGEGALYTKTASSITNLFYTADAGGKQYQMTRANDGNFATFATDTAYTTPSSTLGGWTFLPGNLLLQYGFIIPTHTPGTTTVTFPIAFNNPPYSVQITAKVSSSGSSDDQTAAIRSVTAASFLASTSSSGTVTGFWWIAIGN
jgi:hypothetical protein